MLKAVAVSIDKNLDDDLGFCPWQREPGRVNKAKGYQGNFYHEKALHNILCRVENHLAHTVTTFPWSVPCEGKF